MLPSRDTIPAAVEACKSEDFYRPAHGYIFNAVGSPWPSRPYGGATKGKQRSFLGASLSFGCQLGGRGMRHTNGYDNRALSVGHYTSLAAALFEAVLPLSPRR